MSADVPMLADDGWEAWGDLETWGSSEWEEWKKVGRWSLCVRRDPLDEGGEFFWALQYGADDGDDESEDGPWLTGTISDVHAPFSFGPYNTREEARAAVVAFWHHVLENPDEWNQLASAVHEDFLYRWSHDRSNFGSREEHEAAMEEWWQYVLERGQKDGHIIVQKRGGTDE